MSDEALVAKVTAPRHPVLTGILMGLIFVPGIVGFPWMELKGKSPSAGWFIVIPMFSCIGWMFSGAVFIVLQKYFGREPYKWELLRRSGWRNVAARLKEARADIASEGGSEWTILLGGRGLPAGGESQVRLDGPSATREVGRLTFAALNIRRFDFDSCNDPREQLDIGAEPVPRERLEPFLRAIADIDSRPLDGEAATSVADGYPFELYVLRRGSKKVHAVTGNLSAGCKDERTQTIARGLLDLSHECGTRKTLVGSCDSEGNVIIGGM